MMKRIKQAGAAFLAALLALSMTFTAMAAEGDQPALPDSSMDGKSSITVHKFSVDNMEDYTERANGAELEDDDLLKEATPLPGISFRVTRVADTTETPKNPVDYTGDKPYTKTGETDRQGEYTFEDMPFGLYLVEELEHPDVSVAMEPFLVWVPLTNPTSDGWLYHIHVYPKNVLEDEPEIDKNILTEEGLSQSESISVGDTVTWQLDMDIPTGIAVSQVYKVTDNLDSRLTYAGNLKVFYTDRDGKKTELSDSDYDASVPDGTTGGGTIVIDFDTLAKRANLAGALTGDGDKAPTLTIQFDTTVNESARTLENMGEEIPNKATLDFTNKGGYQYKDESEEPEVHTGGIRIYKVEAGEGGKPLEGAVFKIYTSEQDALSGTGALKDPTDSRKDWEISTNGQGIAYFLGLEYGDYWLVEVQAPSGYNLLAAPIKVELDENCHKEVGHVKVENKAGFTLPVTGGTGTVLFTVAGTALIGGAALLLFLTGKKKKMN